MSSEVIQCVAKMRNRSTRTDTLPVEDLIRLRSLNFLHATRMDKLSDMYANITGEDYDGPADDRPLFEQCCLKLTRDDDLLAALLVSGYEQISRKLTKVVVNISDMWRCLALGYRDDEDGMTNTADSVDNIDELTGLISEHSQHMQNLTWRMNAILDEARKHDVLIKDSLSAPQHAGDHKLMVTLLNRLRNSGHV